VTPVRGPRCYTRPDARNIRSSLCEAVYVVGGSPTPEPSHASVGSAIVERYRSGCDETTSRSKQAR
jgi:hypothetical protein